VKVSVLKNGPTKSTARLRSSTTVPVDTEGKEAVFLVPLRRLSQEIVLRMTASHDRNFPASRPSLGISTLWRRGAIILYAIVKWRVAGRRCQSTEAPESRTMRLHFSDSDRMYISNCWGVFETASAPCVANFSRTAGAWIAA
jgi:hypothetical protein